MDGESVLAIVWGKHYSGQEIRPNPTPLQETPARTRCYMTLLPRNLCLALVLATPFAIGSVPVLAADAKPAKPKKEWSVGMVKGDPAKGEGDKFAYCMMHAPYDNGLTLAVALSPKGEVNVGVQVPSASFKSTDKFPMTITIDKNIKRERPSIAATPELLLTPLGPDKEVLTGLRKGSVLGMAGPQDTAYFSLKGTSKGLTRLQECVDAGTGKAKPVAEKKTAKSGKAPEFPPGLMQLLQESGFNDIQIVPIDDPSKAPVDFAWRTNGVFGGVRGRPMPADVTIEKMTDMIESGFKNQCKGTFTASMGEIESATGMKLRKGEISCKMEKESIDVALLLYLTDAKVFTMFMHEAPLEKKADAIKARDAVTATIKKLAEKPEEKPAK